MLETVGFIEKLCSIQLPTNILSQKSTVLYSVAPHPIDDDRSAASAFTGSVYDHYAAIRIQPLFKYCPNVKELTRIPARPFCQQQTRALGIPAELFESWKTI